MRRINIICSILLTVLFFGCSKESAEEGLGNKENVDLTITIAAPTAHETRAITTDGVTLPTAVADQLSDGWAFNHTTLFVIQNNTIIGYRDVDYRTSAKTAETFNLSDTNDKGNIVQPSEGACELYIVANYQNNQSLTNAVNAVLTALGKGGNKPATGLSVNNAQWTNFLNQKITTGTGNLADKSLMPLSLKSTILLKPGKNVFNNIHLLRTYSRIIVEVRNECQFNDLKINQFDFNTNFTTNQIPLFKNGTLKTANLKPDVTSAAAITPFKPTDGTTVMHMKPNETHTVFDGYVLENASYDTDYLFKIGVSALFKNVAPNSYIEGAPERSMRNGVEYFIRTTTQDDLKTGYVYAEEAVPQRNNKAVEGDSPILTNPEACQKYLWKREGAGLVSVLLESLNKKKFVDGKTNGDVKFIGEERLLNIENGNIYWVENVGTNWNPKYNYNYITTGMQWAVKKDVAPNKDRFEFIPVTKAKSEVQHNNVIVPFEYLQNNKPVPVSEINRNNFFHVLFIVRYNEKSGVFEFEVVKWNDVIGDIEFN